METLYELWGKRNPEWEKRYQDTIMNVFTDYGKGVNQFQDIRGKIYGAGYEIYIIAFFIGLYFDERKHLVDDKEKRKVFGQAIMYWGNIESRGMRSAYGKIREYIFAALIARTDVDFIALDKGEITPRSVVDALITTMEEYANFGFDYIQEKLEDDPNYFFKESAFLRVFTSFLETEEEETLDDEPAELEDMEPAPLDDIEEPAVPEVTVVEKKVTKLSKSKINEMLGYYQKGLNVSQLAKLYSADEDYIKTLIAENS